MTQREKDEMARRRDAKRPLCQVCRKHPIPDHQRTNAKRKYCSQECSNIAMEAARPGNDVDAHEKWLELNKASIAADIFLALPRVS